MEVQILRCLMPDDAGRENYLPILIFFRILDLKHSGRLAGLTLPQVWYLIRAYGVANTGHLGALVVT